MKHSVPLFIDTFSNAHRFCLWTYSPSHFPPPFSTQIKVIWFQSSIIHDPTYLKMGTSFTDDPIDINEM